MKMKEFGHPGGVPGDPLDLYIYINSRSFGVSSEGQLPNVGLGDNKRTHNLPCRFRLVEWVKGHFNL